MRVDKNKLEALASLDDEALWRQIKGIVESRGIKLPDKAPASSELNKFRAICRSDKSFTLTEAMRLISNYKKGV